jgi:hypothetical protein
MEQIECSETSAYKIQTLENYLEESIQLYYFVGARSGRRLICGKGLLKKFEV